MKKEILKIGVIFAVTVGVVLWGLNFIFFKGNAPKSKASGETMNLSFTPATATVAANADFTVNILAKPSINTVLRGYKTKVNFDKAILKLKSIQYKVGVVSAGLGNTTADVTAVNGNGFVDVIGEDTTATGYTLGTANGAELVSLTFTALVATATTVTMTDSSFYSVNADGSLFDTWTIAAQNLDVNGGSSGGTCTSFTDDFSGTALNTTNWVSWNNNGGTVTLVDGQATLNLPDSTENKGVSIYTSKQLTGDFSAEVTLKNHTTADNKLTSNLAFTFSNSDWSKYAGILKVYNKAPGELVIGWKDVSGDKNEGKNDGIDHNTPIKVKIERTGSTFKLSYDKMDGQGYKLLKQLDNYYSGPGGLNIALDNWGPDFPQASATFDDFKLTCGSGGGGTGNVKLNLKLKFQGITKKPSTEALNFIKGKIEGKIIGTNEGFASAPEGNFLVKSDDNGVWSGTVGIDLPQSSLGKKFALFIKGRRHIQKKICDSVPTETSPGTYRCSTGNITLVAGDNNLDFSGILLLVGDLDQNGIVDSVDFGLVKNCLGKSDSVCLSSSDLNLDGRVDTQDFSLIIAALGIRTDEL